MKGFEDLLRDYLHGARTLRASLPAPVTGMNTSTLRNQEEEKGRIMWSGSRDLNPGPLRPERSALPDCATPRCSNSIMRRRQGQPNQVDLSNRGSILSVLILEAYCRNVSVGLDLLAFEERQQLLQLVVGRVSVQDGIVHIETVIPMGQQPAQLRNIRGEPVEP